MSLMKEIINSEVVDNYKEHSQHFTYDGHCSTCYSNALKLPVGKRVFLLIDNNIDNHDYNKDDKDYHEHKDEEDNLPMFGIDLELASNSYN